MEIVSALTSVEVMKIAQKAGNVAPYPTPVPIPSSSVSRLGASSVYHATKTAIAVRARIAAYRSVNH